MRKVSLYIGTEYSDGTFRNKIVVGQGRTAIYLANLITTMVAGWLFLLIGSVAYLVPGIILMENGNPLIVYCMVYAGIFFMLAVFSAIFTCISMVLGKKISVSIRDRYVRKLASRINKELIKLQKERLIILYSNSINRRLL